MPIVKNTDKLQDGTMNCMEVWGGNGATKQAFHRPGLDLWIWCQSRGCAELGGSDLHLLSSCASGRITRMLLADVCGHGRLFAEIAGELRELMKRNVNSVTQGRIVRNMSQRLESAAARGGFASTLVSTYFAPTRSFTCCNAGHPPPLLFRAAERKWSILKQTNPINSATAPPGVVDPTEYQQFTTKLNVADMVLSYSDVITECRTSCGQTLGISGLLGHVQQLDAEEPMQLVTQLATQLKNDHSENLISSDATLLLCRATETAVGWRNNLLAPFRLLRSVSDQTKF